MQSSFWKRKKNELIDTKNCLIPISIYLESWRFIVWLVNDITIDLTSAIVVQPFTKHMIDIEG